MAILEELAARHGFTKTDEALADFILEHADEVVRMRVSELAERSYTSNAAVNRLCRKVGSDGFRAFRVDLNTELERRRAGAEVAPDLQVHTGQSSIDTMSGVAGIFRKAIDACLATVSPMELHSAARAILRSNHVILYAGGDSAVACEQLACDLIKIGVDSVAAYHYNYLWASTYMAHKGDAAVFVSYSGLTMNNLSEHVRTLHDAGCKIIFVTSGDLEPAIMRLCDHLLKLPTGETITKSAGTFFSQMCIRYVLSSLYATAFSIDADSNSTHYSSVVSPDWDR